MWTTSRLTLMYWNFMDLVHELCPAQLLEVTKKSDNLSGWLTSIQHLAHMRSSHPWRWSLGRTTAHMGAIMLQTCWWFTKKNPLKYEEWIWFFYFFQCSQWFHSLLQESKRKTRERVPPIDSILSTPRLQTNSFYMFQPFEDKNVLNFAYNILLWSEESRDAHSPLKGDKEKN